MRRILRAALPSLAAAILLAFLFLHDFLNDPTVPRAGDLIPAGAPRVAMAIFPHPDDEITCAGTLLWLHDRGVRTVLVYLTHGEAGPTGGLVSQAELGRARARESQDAARVLHVDAVEMFDLPDNGLAGLPPARIKAVIAEVIERHRPGLVITYDDKIGLYGHPDHKVAAALTREVYKKRLLQVTLSSGMIRTGLKVSEMFRRNYPKDPALGLPKPDLAVDISAYGSLKKRALLAHRTQWQILGDLQPLIGAFPGWLYYRVFDSEYYAIVPPVGLSGNKP